MSEPTFEELVEQNQKDLLKRLAEGCVEALAEELKEAKDEQ